MSIKIYSEKGNIERTPTSNSKFIKKWYKSSTIGRLKEDLEYRSIENIDNCQIISQWLDLCFYNHIDNGYIQDELFNWINTCNQIKVISEKRKDLIVKMIKRK